MDDSKGHKSDKTSSFLENPTISYIALIFALFLNLVFVVLLIYFETKPFEVQREPREQCVGNATAKNTKLGAKSRAGETAAPNTNNPIPTALTWGKYQVTHSYVMTVPYYSYNVLIYQQTQGAKPTSTDDRDKYFYQPALMLNNQSTRISMNPFTQKYEILVPVVLWNEAYEEHIRQQIMDQTGKDSFLLSVIPLEEIRIKSVNPNTKIQLITRWMAFASQPSIVNFRVVCKDNDTCVELLQQIKDNPDQFVADLRVYYSLESQSSVGKRITVTAEHVQKSSLYAEINQKMRDKDPVYLTSDDANTLQMEIINNIQATEIQDEDFVSDSNLPTLMGLVNEALGMASRNSKDFKGTQVWDSVFWSDDNARPDKITKQLNDFATMLDEESREKLKTEQAKSQKSGYSWDASVSYKKVSVGAGVSEEQTSQELQQHEKDQMKKLVKESKGKSEVQGNLFVPKSMEMKRINTGSIKAGMALSTAVVRISKAKAQIADIIKVINIDQQLPNASLVAISKEPEVFHVRAEENYILFTRNEAKEICKQYNARLATTRQVEEAWVAGGDWCSAGHVEDNRIVYPGHICYTVAKNSSGATLVPLKYLTSSCEEEGAIKKSFVYKSGQPDDDMNAYKATWRFGANCWGLKPSTKMPAIKYGGRLLKVWRFNATHYSLFKA